MLSILLLLSLQSFYMPSGSMRETIIPNDHILVNKVAYCLASPRVGDVVVFEVPDLALKLTGETPDPDAPPIYYTKRVVGAPGDIVVVHHGFVTVGVETFTHHDVRDKLQLFDMENEHLKLTNSGCIVTSVNSKVSVDGVQTLRCVTKTLTKAQLARKLTGLTGVPITIRPGYVERNGIRLPDDYACEDPSYDLKLVNGKAYIHAWDEAQTLLNGQQLDASTVMKCDLAMPGEVPAGEYLLLGDNRNDSNDGSRWGPLEANRIIGRAFFIFYPFDRIHVIR